MRPRPYKRLSSGMGWTGAARTGRPASTAMFVHLDGLLAVLGQERLLKARLAAHEVEQVVLRGGPDHRRDRPGDAQAKKVVIGHDIADAGQARECRDGHRAREAQLD